MWTCPSCGERIEDQFDACWECGTSGEGVRDENLIADMTDQREETHNVETSDANVPPERMLSQILRVQREQKEVLGDIQWKVGCLFVYMIVGIALGLLAGLVAVAQ